MAGGKIDILVEPDVKNFSSKLESGLGPAMGVASKLGASLGLALGGAEMARAVGQIGMEFESQINSMAAVSQATGAQLDAVRAKARDLGTDTQLTGTSAADAAAAMTELAKGGFSVEQSMTAARGTLQLAAAAQVDAAEAATIQSQALQAFSLGAGDAARVSDILAGAANASSAEMTGISQGLQQAGTVANAFGVSIDDTATSLAMMANAGIQGSDAGTLLKSAMLALTDQGKPAQQAIEELGLTVYDAQGKFVGMESLMGQLQDASKRMTDEQYQAATATLFGSDAMRLAGIAAEQGSEGFAKLREMVTRQGQAAEVAAAQTQGLPGVWERFQNTMEDVRLGVFDAVKDELIDTGNAAVSMVDKASPAIETFAGLTASTFGTATQVIGKSVEVWGQLPQPVKEAAIALGTVQFALKALQTERGAAMVTKLTDAFTSSRAGIKVFGSSLTEAYGYMRQANPEMSRTGAAMRVLGGQGGVAAAGMDKLKGAGSGLMNMLGGPWGIALAGATAVVGDLIAFNQRAAQAQENYRRTTDDAAEAQQRLNVALAGTTTPLSKEQMEDAATVAAGFTASMRAGAETMEGWRGAALGAVDVSSLLGYSTESIAGKMETMADAATLTGDTLEKQGKTWDDLGKIIADGGAEYQQLISQLENTDGHWWNDQGEAAQKAAADLESARHEYERAIDAARNADPSFRAVGDAMRVLSDEASTAEDKLGALKKIMDEVSDNALTKDQAQASLVENVGKQAEQIADLGREVAEIGPIQLDPDGTIDATTESGSKAVQMITELRDSMAQAAASGVEVDEIFAQQAGNMEGLQQALGLTDDQFQKLMESYGMTREILALPLEMKGADSIEQQVQTLITGLSTLQEGRSVEIAPPDPAVVLALESIGFEIEHLPNGNIEITTTADTEKEKLSDLGDTVDEINGMHAEATAELDVSSFGLNADQARAIGEDLDGLDVSPEADLIIEKLLQGKDISMGELQTLSAETAIPTASLEKSLLDAGVNEGLIQTANLGSQTPTPRADANTDSFTTKIGAALNLAAKLSNPITTVVTFVGRKVGSWLGGHEGGGRIPGFAIGGQIPKLAAGGNPDTHGGYRLPTSGPGTDRVDGILGLDFSGQPTAWVNAGEWVTNANRSAIFDNSLAAINRGTPQQIAYAVAQDLQHLADGGKVSAAQLLAFAAGENVLGQQASQSLNGAPYVFGGSNWGDCSSSQGQLALFSVGKPATNGRFMSTMDEQAQLTSIGFQMGMGSGPRYAIGWFNAPGTTWGGHTSGSIIDESGKQTNVEMGGSGPGGGKIGGAAAPYNHAQFTDHAWIPLVGNNKDQQTGADGKPLEIESTGVDGLTTSGGSHVDWGEARELYDTALEFARRTRVYDSGGILKPGDRAVNLGTRPERILDPKQTDAYELAIRTFPGAAGQIAHAADAFNDGMRSFEKASDNAQNQVVSYGFSFGGDYLAQAKIVQDAEQGLIETRRAVAEENDAVAEREKELREARKALADAEKEGGGLSTSQKRKLEDSQRKLDEARASGDAKKIADAERNLSRAREDAAEALEKSEDKNAKAVLSAQKKVEKAEDNLSKAREETADQSARLVAAERTVAAARYQAAADLVTGITEQWTKQAGIIEDFWSEMARAAEYVDKLRESVSKLQMDKVNADLEMLRAQQELQIKEQDVFRARARGVMSIAEAEHALQEARKAETRLGLTSIEAMGGAMDRFRATGIFAIEELSESVVDNAAAVKAAEWGVYVARKQAALDEHEAITAQAIAAYELADATLTQNAAVEMLRLQTTQLTAQAKELYGLTSNQATGASKGFGGVGKVTGGIGKIIGGVLAGIAGFAVGGPLGALAGAGMALGGLKDTVQGSIDIHQNKKEMDEAWKNMDSGSKAGIVLGTVGGAALTAGGAALSTQLGPDAAVGGAELATKFMDATIGGVQYGIAGKIDKLKRDAEDQQGALEREIQAKKNQLSGERLAYETEAAAKKDALNAAVEFGKLQQQLAEANTKDEARAIAAAAEVEAERMGHMLDVSQKQHAELAQIKQQMAQLVTLTSEQAKKAGTGLASIEFTLPEGEAFTRPQMESMLDQVKDALEHRLAQLEKADEPTATAYFAARG